MDQEIPVIPVHTLSPKAAAHLQSALPILRRLPDDEAVEMLHALFVDGVNHGIQTANASLVEMGSELMKIADARLHGKGDEAVIALVDDFISRRCKVIGDTAKTH
jgi:hypothetical protein